MDEEQYRVEGWRRVLVYRTDAGREVDLWEADLDGLREMDRIRRSRRDNRRAERVRRSEEEDNFREYVDALEDQKAPYRSGKEGD